MRQSLHLVGRKRLILLALSLVLLAYLALVRNDTTRSDLATGGGMVLALWGLAGWRAYMTAGETSRQLHRGTTDAR
jgi:hypothetical protein